LTVAIAASIDHHNVQRLPCRSPEDSQRRALGVLGKDLGTVEPGKVADLLVVGADPTAEVANLRKVRYVVRGGAVRPDRGTGRSGPVVRGHTPAPFSLWDRRGTPGGATEMAPHIVFCLHLEYPFCNSSLEEVSHES
jgi:hypothetical protein